jgi:hypothetical protein
MSVLSRILRSVSDTILLSRLRGKQWTVNFLERLLHYEVLVVSA